MAKKRVPTAVSEYMAKIGAKGGKARGVELRARRVPVTGAAVPKETPCARCGEILPSARQAWRHCRAEKPGPKNKS